MRILGNPLGNDPKVVSGESGAVGLGMLSLLMERDDLKDMTSKLKLDKDSKILNRVSDHVQAPKIDRFCRDASARSPTRWCGICHRGKIGFQA